MFQFCSQWSFFSLQSVLTFTGTDHENTADPWGTNPRSDAQMQREMIF